MTKKRVRLRNLTTLSDRSVDIAASLTTYQEEERALTETERIAYQMFWEEDADDIMPLYGASITCIKQVQEAYTWVKEVPVGFYDEGGVCGLMVRMKKVRKRSKKFGTRDDCVELNLFFDYDRTNVSGEGLAAEMIELRKWIGSILE